MKIRRQPNEGEPDLLILTAAEMRERMGKRTNPPWYVKLGIMPGGGINRDPLAVVITEKTWDAGRRGRTWARRLIAHEYGHAMRWPLEDHTGDPIQRLKHAWTVRFDVRASNRFLRWRDGSPHRFDAAMVWFGKAWGSR